MVAENEQAHKHVHGMAKLEEIDFNNIIQRKDDWHVENYVSQHFVGNILSHFLFKSFIVTLVIGNSITIACETTPELAEKYENVLSLFKKIVLVVFMAEIFLKWYYGFEIFWKDGWNVLDFIIVMGLFVGPTLPFIGNSKVLQILRVLKIMRSLTSVRGLSMMIQVILQSLPDLANIFILLVIIMLVFSVFGVLLFGKLVPLTFGNLIRAMYSLFICITQDGWMNLYQDFQWRQPAVMIGGAVYFFIFLTSTAFIFVNLMVAVVTTNLEQAMLQFEGQQTLITNVLTVNHEQHVEEENLPDIEMIHLHQVMLETSFPSQQQPIYFSSLENLTIKTFEEFCLVLEAIQINLKEYKNIRLKMGSIIQEVREIFVNREQEQAILKRNQQPPAVSESLLNNNIAAGRTGDTFSTLMPVEQTHTTDSGLPHLFKRGAITAADLNLKRQ
nr:PREDICTED: cation channel sperm-associated protein 4 isoform X2 [Latimeria chalumnae]|eukprot:XP_014342687.1 PREDICTED: cation channel sperm-associated protein 4 isoform X2 [Latimeria chalumnae]